MKTCGSCKETLPLAAFYPKVGGRFGVEGTCKECRKAGERIRYEQDGEKMRSRAREWQQANKASRAEYNRKWRQKNSDAIREKDRQRGGVKNLLYRMQYPEKAKAIATEAARRRAFRTAQATPVWAEVTGEPHHVDHIVPISSPLVCGLHVEYNLQILPAGENLAKRNNFEVETF